ncbi:hypothetical protein [Burkholderia ubonensis]|uniref:hypothetical protein n=1 Tax=Burkholderia ubonensis TaxID=101571 RepID=UPI0015A6E6F2|nr:hypothetical protein [Burkholderia ubonensis]
MRGQQILDTDGNLTWRARFLNAELDDIWGHIHSRVTSGTGVVRTDFFLVGVPISPDGKQSCNPLIMQWNPADQVPAYDVICAEFKSQEATIREADVRSLRDEMLQNTDQFAHAQPDAPIAARAKAQAWIAYREVVRAPPSNRTFRSMSSGRKRPFDRIYQPYLSGI